MLKHRGEATSSRGRATPGDAAVDGLLAGLGAGIAMLLYLVGIALFVEESVTVMVSRFALDTMSPLAGVLIHLAISGVYGLIFGLLWRVVAQASLPVLPTAVGYGLLLWLAAQTMLLPDSGSALREIAPLHFALAHLLYGLTLGMILHRMQET